MADNNLYKRGTIWWARFQVGGEEHRRSLRTGNRAEAKKRLGIEKEKIGHARYYGGSRLVWKEAVTRYVNEVLGGLQPSTGKRYKVSLRQAEDALADKFLDAIGSREIASLVAARKKAGATNATIRRDLTAVSRVFVAGRSWGACHHNPAKDYDRDMIRERRDPIVLPSDDDVARAVKLAPIPLFGRIMVFAGQTGMRQGEILGLTWAQVDLARKAITLTKTKTNQPRMVPLVGPLLESVHGTLAGTERRRNKPLVFGQEDGTAYQNFPSQFAAWRRRNDVPFRFHDLRHKFAVAYLRGGGNIYDLQLILGHASIKTTEGYLRYLTPEEQRHAKHPTAQNQAQANVVSVLGPEAGE